MSMTTADVLDALQQTGWRWERLGGDLPVLTNAPVGQEFCIYCGRWQEHARFRFGRCATCHNAEVKRERQELFRTGSAGVIARARARKRRYEQGYREKHRTKLRAYQRDYQRRRRHATQRAGTMA